METAKTQYSSTPMILKRILAPGRRTWQALGGVGYRFSKADLVLGYRHMEWNFDGNSVFDDLDISGPYAGVKFVF